MLLALSIAFWILCSSACTDASDDQYKNEPKNCLISAGSAGGSDIPVVCSQPVKIDDVLNQPRDKVESILGKGYSAGEIGFYPKIKGWIAYQGGGVIVSYDDNSISKMMRVTTDRLKLNHKEFKNDEKSFRDFFSASSIEYIRSSPRSCTPFLLAYFDDLEHPMSISPVGSGGFHIIYKANIKIR